MRLFIFSVIAVFCFVLPAVAAQSEKIAAVVNHGAITMSDVEDRIRLIAVSSGLPMSPDIEQKLWPQIIDSLIEEQIITQEAARLEISVEDQEISEGFAQIARQNNMTDEQFQSVLRRTGIDTATMRKQIESQLAWSKVIQQKLRPQVNIADSDVDDYIERIKASRGKTEYLAAEIFLPVEDAQRQDDVRQLANRLVNEIRSGKAPFFKLAQQFSRAAGASQGGDLGWVQEGQLDPALETALGGLEKNSVSNPVRTLTGYHILMLRDQRTITDASVPDREQATRTLGIQRLERLQRRYLMDLKASAFIETRDHQAG